MDAAALQGVQPQFQPIHSEEGQAANGAQDDEGGYCGTIQGYWATAQEGVQKFTMDYPLIAIITAVVFGIFGISQVLPIFITTCIVGIPLVCFAYLSVKTIWENREEFSQRLVLALAAASAHNALQQGAIQLPQVMEQVGDAAQQVGHVAQQLGQNLQQQQQPKQAGLHQAPLAVRGGKGSAMQEEHQGYVFVPVLPHPNSFAGMLHRTLTRQDVGAAANKA
jgi:hypothetical protein